MSKENILLILSNSKTGQMLERTALSPAGFRVTLASEWEAAKTIIEKNPPDLVIVSETIEDRDSTELVSGLLEENPFTPIILLPETHSEKHAINAFRRGYSDYLQPPVHASDLLQAVTRSLEKRWQWEELVRQEAKRDTKNLRKRINGLEAIQRVGRKVTSLLELDSILTAVVDAAVELSKAEEGSLLLLDENSGELYMRASRNFQEEFVKTFRLPIQDTIAGQVLRSGKPLLIDEKKPTKIYSSFLVSAIIYVPLVVQDRVIGILEVDNRKSKKNPFSDYHVTLISALADYAAIAIENSRLYSHSEFERNKLKNILTGLEESVIVIDNDERLALINPKALETFEVKGNNLTGKRISEIIQHQEFLEIISDARKKSPARVELNLEDGRVLNAQLTHIHEIGTVVSMQDITHLKELDRIKSDFVNTVSHDLRSPLTAILGYVELIDRVGPVNPQQVDFIERIQASVHNITSLIDDLLDLGRIEAGFDARNEIVDVSAIIQYAVDSLQSRADEKSQEIHIEIADTLPSVLGNPVRLRQMISNMIANSIRYTPEKGRIAVFAQAEDEQVILQVIDNGPGIPPADQPYIFDKFYRASNVSLDVPGTGLGLAIVKSIVENHLGRVWVSSKLGEGATFTVVLPTFDQDL